ncbi:hypothetical protein [Kordiimonas aquimaris]|uniref:hypothetical protein n=1 Tax=Kordiimonas aquimaris TaxID=707591 RepID=UPI0021D041C7|nr:hypothetical protein [Kordiimonas aquimaris]
MKISNKDARRLWLCGKGLAVRQQVRLTQTVAASGSELGWCGHIASMSNNRQAGFCQANVSGAVMQ